MSISYNNSVEERTKMEGSVKFYNRKKGFGFISGDDGTDYFVHISALPQGVFLRDGDRVSFDPAEGERGAKADNVQLLQKASDMEGGDAPAEESAEEAPAEEPAEESTEEPAEEAPAEEPAEESTEEPAEETPAEEPAEESTEEPAEETPAEEPAEESTEEPAEEAPAEESSEEPKEE